MLRIGASGDSASELSNDGFDPFEDSSEDEVRCNKVKHIILAPCLKQTNAERDCHSRICHLLHLLAGVFCLCTRREG